MLRLSEDQPPINMKGAVQNKNNNDNNNNNKHVPGPGGEKNSVPAISLDTRRAGEKNTLNINVVGMVNNRCENMVYGSAENVLKPRQSNEF